MRPRTLPIAESSGFARPIREWINLAEAKKAELEILLQRKGVAEARGWIEREFVDAAGTQIGIDSKEDAGLVDALREARRRADERQKLTPDLLLQINALISGNETQWNNSRAEIASRLACDWFEADSFNELHALEQAATVYLRLCEIQAFERFNQITSLLAASVFTMRAGFPPIIIPSSMEKAQRAAFSEAARMNTRPMVELMASAMILLLTSLIEIWSVKG